MATRDRWHGHRSWNIDHSNDDDGNISLLGSMSAVSTTAPLMNKSKKLFSFWSVFLVLLIAGVLFLVGFFLGYFVRESFDERANFTTGYKAYQFDKAKLEAIHENVMYFISRDPDKIKTFSSEFGIDDPLTNSVLEKKLEHTVYQELINYNFDSVDVEDYSVVVTYPDPNRPNRLEVLDQSGSVLANFTLKNSVSRGDNPMGKTVSAKSRYAKYPYVAFTKAGYAEGGLLFGHYGRRSDLLQLKHHEIDVKGHLLLLRLGKISVDEKVSIATKAGADGVLLYWDPADGATDAPENSSYIPYASARPEDGSDLHKIPVQTVSANMAAWLMRHMRGEAAPQHWAGGLNVMYVLGLDTNDTTSFRLTSYNKEQHQSIRNVIGSIHGYQEPDRYILIGAPRSGFPGSSSDAVLATSMMLQLARSLEYMQSLENWKPGRGIKLVSWGGHEFSQAGKTEYIKANSHLLDRRAIAYFDLTRMTLGNESVRAEVSPGFYPMIRQAAARVPDPTHKESTIADSWPSPVDMKNNQKRAPLYTFHNDQEHNPFLQIVGIPEIHVQYVGENTPSSSSTRDMAVLDLHHHFKYHIAVMRVVTLAALHLVDGVVLPISLTDYAEDIHLVTWQTSGELEHCSSQMVDLESEVSDTEDLVKTATAFRDFIIIYEDKSDKLGIHSSNEVKMMFERIFIKASNHKRHHLLYPQSSDGRITALTGLCNEAQFSNNWDAVDNYVDDLRTALLEASRCLRTNE